MLKVIMDGAVHSTKVLNEDNDKCPGESASKLVSPTTEAL